MVKGNLLSISILNSFAHYIYFSSNKERSLLESSKVSVSEISQQISTFNNAHQNIGPYPIKISLPVKHFTIIPSSLFDPSKLLEIWNTVHAPVPLNNLLVEELEEENSVLISHINSDLKNDILKSIPNIDVHTWLFQLIKCRAIILPEDALLVIKNSSNCYIMVTKNGKLHFLNSFHIETTNDVAYYILSTYEQLHLDLEKIPTKHIALQGTFSEEYNILNHYIRHIIPLDTSAFTMSFSKKSLKNHYFPNILHLLCA